MIRNAVGTVISRTIVAARTNRASGRFAPTNEMTNGAAMMTAAVAAAPRTRSSGTTVKMTLPGRVRRLHVRLSIAIYLSTPPMIGSSEAMIAIVSAMRLPGVSSPTAWRWTKLGSWIRIRNGWSVPSLIA